MKAKILAFNKPLTTGLAAALCNEETYPRGLRALNTTLYTMSTSQLNKILSVQKNSMIVNVTVEVEPGEKCKNEMLKALEHCKSLEQIEIVANPSMQFFMEVRSLMSAHISLVPALLVCTRRLASSHSSSVCTN